MEVIPPALGQRSCGSAKDESRAAGKGREEKGEGRGREWKGGKGTEGKWAARCFGMRSQDSVVAQPGWPTATHISRVDSGVTGNLIKLIACIAACMLVRTCMHSGEEGSESRPWFTMDRGKGRAG